ncbi:hypothetical protein [Pseudoalteromonas sp. GB56]
MVNKLSRVICFFLSIVLVGCATTYKGDNNETAMSYIYGKNDTTIIFVGPTNETNASNLEELLKRKKGYKTLEIHSQGGSVKSGMKIGRLVHDYKLKLVVKELCLSSCANYIATAAESVLVTKGSAIGWHGGAFQDFYVTSPRYPLWAKVLLFILGHDFEEEELQLQQISEDWQLQELEFFSSNTNVDPVIMVLGMMPGYKERRTAPLFSYDVKTLRRLGLNIEFEKRAI